MPLITVFLIALSLSFDTFAVSVSNGLILKHIRFWQASRIAIILAVFQAAMPLVGWLVGERIIRYAKDFDHWIAFAILALLGLKMIVESMRGKGLEIKTTGNPLDITYVIGIAVATSIDALMVGFSMAMVNVRLMLTLAIIGIVTYTVAMLGMLFGKNIGAGFGKRMEILGGIVLILIACNILHAHHVF